MGRRPLPSGARFRYARTARQGPTEASLRHPPRGAWEMRGREVRFTTPAGTLQSVSADDIEPAAEPPLGGSPFSSTDLPRIPRSSWTPFYSQFTVQGNWVRHKGADGGPAGSPARWRYFSLGRLLGASLIARQRPRTSPLLHL
jgi:hypothetical protein